jgi:hypothetical protein
MVFEHRDLVLNKADSEMHHVGDYEEFSCIGRSLQCYNEDADCGEASVKQIAAKYQKTSEDQATDEDDTTVNESVTNRMQGNVLLGCGFISCK